MSRLLMVALCGVALLAGAADAAAQRRPGEGLAERANGDRQKGAQDAKVVVLEIADFQCPFCARFAVEVFPRIDSAYVKTGKVGWLFVNLPLPNHAHAWLASEAAMCAGGVAGRFWPMHDRIFAAQAEWSRAADPGPLFRRYAQQLGLPLEEYDACVAGDQVAPLLLRDLMWAAPRVRGTPAFLINDEPVVSGLRSFEEWQKLLDAALQKPRP